MAEPLTQAKPSSLVSLKITGGSATMANERRRAPRYPLIATAEIIEPQTNLRLRGRTLELSLVGCYVEVKNTLPVRTEIRVQIIHNDAIFSALGVITSCEPNRDMSIKFTDVQLDQHEILEKWLAARVRD